MNVTTEERGTCCHWLRCANTCTGYSLLADLSNGMTEWMSKLWDFWEREREWVNAAAKGWKQKPLVHMQKFRAHLEAYQDWLVLGSFKARRNTSRWMLSETFLVDFALFLASLKVQKLLEGATQSSLHSDSQELKPEVVTFIYSWRQQCLC